MNHPAFPELFRAVRLNERVTRIRGISDELMYLIEGDDRAALIDTGVGIGNLKNFIDGLTDKPLIVLITHAHVDHVMGASLFDEVYMNPDDFPIYEDHRRIEKRHVYLKRYLGKRYALVTDDTFINAPPLQFRPMQPGDQFSLGGLTLEVFAAPGHSPGSSVILLRELRILLLGDACNTLTVLFDEHAPTVEEYRENMVRLREETRGLFDHIYLSHGLGDGPPDMIDSVISVCGDVMGGDSDNIPFQFLEHKLIAARKINAALMRTDGGSANIIYDPNKIFRTDSRP